MLELINVEKEFINSKKEDVVALTDINLKVEEGDFLSIVGPSGSGKSTLIDIMMGLLDPTHGTLEVDENVITSSNRRAWQSRIAHVPQNIYLSLIHI